MIVYTTNFMNIVAKGIYKISLRRRKFAASLEKISHITT